ncbi:MAG: SGNH/GDSL hydrolase family protein [Cyclobacteriaceae bacterium]
MKLLLTGLILSISFFTNSDMNHNQSHSFLALGDSYTIGEAVEEEQRWPVQLAKKLSEGGVTVSNPEIIATTGWTTDELLAAIDKADMVGNFNIVSLLIGVNNQYRGYPIVQYKNEFTELLEKAIQFAGGNPESVFVVSIPDYGVTPFVKDKGLDSDKIEKELYQYNQLAKEISETLGVVFIDITPGSRLAKNDDSFVASDGLHPSGKMYTQWTDLIYSTIYDNLSSR